MALGVLSGNERAVALGHLAGCPACQEHLDDLVRVADTLLLLGPAQEPPIGFESRVLARIQAEGTPPAAPSHRRWSARRRLVTLAAVASVAVAGATAGLIAANSESPARPATVISRLVWAGKSTCQMVALAPADPGGPSWLMVRLHEVGAEDGRYPVSVEAVSGGPPVAVGTVSVRGGLGMQGFSIPSSIGKIKAVLVHNNGNSRLLYRATFPPI
jgi:hypothetical protein